MSGLFSATQKSTAPSMIDIQTYQNRQGEWTATVTISEYIENMKVPNQVSYQVKPQKSHSDLLEYIATRIVDDGKVLIKADKGSL